MVANTLRTHTHAHAHARTRTHTHARASTRSPRGAWLSTFARVFAISTSGVGGSQWAARRILGKKLDGQRLARAGTRSSEQNKPATKGLKPPPYQLCHQKKRFKSTRTHTNTHTRKHTQPHTHTNSHTHTQTRTCVYLRVCMCAVVIQLPARAINVAGRFRAPVVTHLEEGLRGNGQCFIFCADGLS